MSKQLISVLILLLLTLLLSGCEESVPSQDRVDKNKLTKSYILNEILDESKLNSYDFPKEEIEEAVSAANSLKLKDQEKIWFIRYWFLFKVNDKKMNLQKIYEDSQLRISYEKTWKNLAIEKYGIIYNEKTFDELIKDELAYIEKVKPNVTFENFVKALDFTDEEFYYLSEKNRIERQVINNELLPILERAYGEKDARKIFEQYKMEVIDRLIERLS